MLEKTMEQKEVVKILLGKIHLIIQKQKDNDAELVMCLVELEKLEAQKFIAVYNTFDELIEGEFGWSELKFRSAKSMLLTYGAEQFREYGREVLQCVSRLNDAGQSEIFSQLRQYKFKKNKVPGYGAVSTWVRNIGGKFTENGTGGKVVDIKKKYLEALEEIKSLNTLIREQGEEIAQLNVFIKGKKA